MKKTLGSPILNVVVMATVAMTPVTAFAYVGPGAGITMIGALIGVIVAIGGMIGAVLFWPVRAMLRRRKAAAAGTSVEEGEGKGDAKT